jgi:hypothetical protein
MSDATRKASIFTFARLLNGTLMSFWFLIWTTGLILTILGLAEHTPNPILFFLLAFISIWIGIWELSRVFTYIQYSPTEIMVDTLWVKRKFLIRDVIGMYHVKYWRLIEITLLLIDKQSITLMVDYQGARFSAGLLRFLIKENGLKIRDSFIQHICDNY